MPLDRMLAAIHGYDERIELLSGTGELLCGILLRRRVLDLDFTCLHAVRSIIDLSSAGDSCQQVLRWDADLLTCADVEDVREVGLEVLRDRGRLEQPRSHQAIGPALELLSLLVVLLSLREL